ncbi:glycosyltransferase family 2 protein [Sphaerimonospora mesophila]|uniref:glycosyltransferase family 2 protein n=1 Tax=Sphaerimonospora mesophila TaxID=37483 RepID=UPI0006E3345C
MGVKVSVVVPVSDPGLENDAFGACVRSLLEQSLPPEEYEVIFADDGSTDGTRRRLDAVAERRSNVRVLHLDHSGSVARGRNLGLSVARGEYVYLMNQCDRLEPHALERMYGMAVDSDADVLIGRLVDGPGNGSGNAPPHPAFAVNQPRADILRDRLLALPSVHKLFDREFLERRQLRFLDRPLSEQLFTTRAYLSAKVIAVLAEDACCHLGPAEEEVLDAEALFEGLGAIFDVVDACTEPGVQRDRIYAHWYRVLGLRRLGGPRFLTAAPDERALLFSFLRRLTLDRIPETVDAHLPVRLRARTALLRQDRPGQLVELGEASRGTRLDARLRDLRWERGTLALDLSVEILQADGSPMWLREQDGRLLWTPPAPIRGLADPALADVTGAVRRARMEVYIRDPRSGVTYPLPVESTVGRTSSKGRVRVWVRGEARLDVGSAALGRPLPRGVWEIHVRMRGVHPGRARVGRPDVGMTCAGVLADEPRRLVTPCWSERGELGVCVAPGSFSESITLVSSRTSVARQAGHAFVVVPVPYVPPSGGPPVELVLREQDGRGRSMAVPALVEPGIPGRIAGRLVAKVPVSRVGGEDRLGPGTWRPSLRIDQKEADLRFGLSVGRAGQVNVLRPGRVRRPGAARPSRLRRLAARVFRSGRPRTERSRNTRARKANTP